MIYQTDILSLRFNELASALEEYKCPSYRVSQVFSWLHEKKAVSFDEMTNLPKNLRNCLKETFFIPRVEIIKKLVSRDGTVKLLVGFADGSCVETVAMMYEHGYSVCISSQVGCKMGCSFCASAKAGFVRDLVPSEMLLQIYAVEHILGLNIDSVVIMGIGEPLDNYSNVMAFYDIITDAAGRNLANRSVTLSTCGVVPGIYALADRQMQLTLSISLHSADNDRRSVLMSVNKTWGLPELMAACRYYFNKTGRRITFEYSVIHGENDSSSDADKLERLLSGFNTHVNLIPINHVSETDYYATRKHAEDFLTLLKGRGLNATIRRTLGDDINAACGQLRRDSL